MYVATGNNCTSPSTRHKASAATTKSKPMTANTSTVAANARPCPKPRSGANAEPSAANSDSIASNNAKVHGAPKPGPRPDAPIQMGSAELGKAAICSDLFNTGFDTDLQMPSIGKRSRASTVLERQCLWHGQKVRRQNLRRKINTRF